MAEQARVCVIGAGIVGSSIAYHLTCEGISDVVVLDRSLLPGWGSTGRAAGGFRLQFADQADIAFSRFALERLLRFERDTGVSPQLRQFGYLFLAQSPKRLAQLREINAIQQAAGLSEAVMLDREGVAEVVPHVRTDDVLGGSFCPLDGFMDPLYIMHGYLRAAMSRGARFRFNVEALAIESAGGRVNAVIGRDFELAAEWVVIAGGAWSGRLLDSVGTGLKVSPLRRQIAGTHPLPGLPDMSPMTIEEDGFHFRKDHLGGGGAMLIYEDPAQEFGFDHQFDPAFGAALLPRLKSRLRQDPQAMISPRKSWGGLYAVTPDSHPYIGPLGDPAGVVIAAGFSGHGAMHSPATGWSVAQMIARSETPALARPYAPDRLASGAAFVPSGNIY